MVTLKHDNSRLHFGIFNNVHDNSKPQELITNQINNN